MAIKNGGTITNMLGTFKYVDLAKTGNIKILNCLIEFTGSLTTWEYNIMGKIDQSEYKPIYGFTDQLIAYNTAFGTYVPIQLNIGTEGEIMIYCTDKTNLEGIGINFHIIYV